MQQHVSAKREWDWILGLEVCGLLSLAAFACWLHGSRSLWLDVALISLAVKRCRPDWPSTRSEVLSIWRFVTPFLYGVSLVLPVVLTSIGVARPGLALTRFAFAEGFNRLRAGVANRGVRLTGYSGLDLLQFCSLSILPQVLGLLVIAIAVYGLFRPGRLPVPPVITGAAACIMCLLAGRVALMGDRLMMGWTIYFLSFYVSFVLLPTHRAVTFIAINLTGLLLLLPSAPNVDY